MESKKINQLATELAPELSDLTIIGDPTTGISKKITLSQMANLFTGTVEEYASLSAFPLVGTADTIYIALDTNVIYRWNSGTSSYNELSPNIVTSLVFSDANGFDGTISLVGSTATLSITTALTAGSVPFIGASGALSQDNANHYWDNTNKRLGINTSSPTTALDVFGSGIIGRINGTSTNNAFLGFSSAGSNKWSIGNVQSDHRFRIYSEANTSEFVSVLQTGEVGIGIANPLTKLHIFGGASALITNLDANTSVAKSISFRSGNSSRINLEVSGTESGSNAGMDLFIRTYSDAGALLNTPLKIVRSTSYSYFATNVIIGGTAASRKLQVNTSGNDGIRISTSGDNPTLDLMQTAAANAGARNWRIVTNWEGWGTFDIQSGTTNTQDPATTRMSISGTTGRVGIGTGTPNSLLHISGTTPAFTLSDSAATGNNGNVYIRAEKVGVGYNNLNYIGFQHIFKGGGSESTFLTIDSAGTSTFVNRVIAESFRIPSTGGAASTNWTLLRDQYATGDFGIYADNTARIIISPTGNFGIGATSPGTKLDVVGSMRLTEDAYPQILIRNATDNNRQLMIGFDYSNNAGYIQSIQQGVAYRILYLNANGGAVYAGGVRLDTLSDVRMKDNIQPIESALNKVLSITGKKFHLKDEEEGKLRYGFIAQELEGILDEFVIETKMTYKDESTNEEIENLKSIENWASSWAALLVEAIKEQQAQIEELKAKIK